MLLLFCLEPKRPCIRTIDPGPGVVSLSFVGGSKAWYARLQLFLLLVVEKARVDTGSIRGLSNAIFLCVVPVRDWGNKKQDRCGH